ncbi:hypothetical protein KXD40_007160 [Peronospora effusa]|nr:hypothetical protein KXD40_007160 [Peronospora effusa]
MGRSTRYLMKIRAKQLSCRWYPTLPASWRLRMPTTCNQNPRSHVHLVRCRMPTQYIAIAKAVQARHFVTRIKQSPY